MIDESIMKMSRIKGSLGPRGDSETGVDIYKMDSMINLYYCNQMIFLTKVSA